MGMHGKGGSRGRGVTAGAWRDVRRGTMGLVVNRRDMASRCSTPWIATYEALRRKVWGARAKGDPKVVRAFVKRLRKKLGDDATPPPRLHGDEAGAGLPAWPSRTNRSGRPLVFLECARGRYHKHRRLSSGDPASVGLQNTALAYDPLPMV